MNKDFQLQPGERLICVVRPGRAWYDLLKTILIDAAAITATIFLFRSLERSFVASYIHPVNLLDWGQFVAIYLFLGVMPTLIILALIQDFAFIFCLQLTLTDRRIMGRMSGFLFARTIDLPLREVEAVSVRSNRLVIQRRNDRALIFPGFGDYRAFASAFDQHNIDARTFAKASLESLGD